MIRAVLLDLDGTLIDSNDAHAQSWVQALSEFNYNVEFRQVRPLIGMGGDQLLPELLGLREETSLGQKISKRRGEIFRSEFLPYLKPFEKARELVEKIRERKFDIVVASSASKADLESLLEKIGIVDLIEKTTSADDADRSKPHPDIVSAALAKTDANPQEALMIGDTPYDIEAAAKAGVRTIAFTSGGWDEDSLKDALAIYDGPWTLLADFDISALNGNFKKQIHVGTHVETGNLPLL